MARVIATGRCVLTAFVLAAVCAAPAMASTAGPHPSAPPQASAGSLGIRLLDAPASEAHDPRAQIYIVDHLAPGTVIRRGVEVTNSTSAAVHVALYSAAATIAKGSFLGAAGHTANALSRWTSITPGAVDLAPGHRARATVTISVPRDATDGEQYAVVWAEVRSTPGPAGGVTEISRVGIRLYLSIGPGGGPASDFAINSLTAERTPAGQPMVLAAVHNTGGRALDMSGTLRLSGGPGGLSAGPFPASLGTTLAIGDTEPVTIDVNNQLPAGPWHAQITLRSGLVTHSARATITFPRAGAAAMLFRTATPSGWQHIAIVGLIFFALGAATLLVVRRRVRGSA